MLNVCAKYSLLTGVLMLGIIVTTSGFVAAKLLAPYVGAKVFVLYHMLLFHVHIALAGPDPSQTLSQYTPGKLPLYTGLFWSRKPMNTLF